MPCVKSVRTDNAPELVSSLLSLTKVIHEKAIPHAHESHSRRERENFTDEQGARSLLLQSGLPLRFWPYADIAFCHNFNVVFHDASGTTAYPQRYPTKPLKHLPLPFGALKPPPSEWKAKFEPSGTLAVCLGSYLASGGQPDGSHYVIPLSQFSSEYGGYYTIVRTRDIKLVGSVASFPVAEARKEHLMRCIAERCKENKKPSLRTNRFLLTFLLMLKIFVMVMQLSLMRLVKIHFQRLRLLTLTFQRLRLLSPTRPPVG